jgi:hypothetical protein
VKLSNTATIAAPASHNLFSRLLAKIDTFLMVWAESNIRNGDVPASAFNAVRAKGSREPFVSREHLPSF